MAKKLNIITKVNNLKKVLSYNSFKAQFLEILKYSNVDEIIIKTIQDRLYEKGEDSKGDVLQTDIAKEEGNSFYSDFTIKAKNFSGGEAENVTLYESGDFYNSFDSFISNNGLNLVAKFKKSDSDIYDNFTSSYSSTTDFEDAILNLTTNERIKLIKTEILPILVKSIKDRI